MRIEFKGRTVRVEKFPTYIRIRGVFKVTFYKVMEHSVDKLTVFRPMMKISHAEMKETPGQFRVFVGSEITEKEYEKALSMFDFK